MDTAKTEKEAIEGLVSSLNLAVDYLKRWHRGERIDRKIIAEVIAGLGVSLDKETIERGHIRSDFANASYHYFKSLEANGEVREFWDKQVKEYLAELDDMDAAIMRRIQEKMRELETEGD